MAALSRPAHENDASQVQDTATHRRLQVVPQRFAIPDFARDLQIVADYEAELRWFEKDLAKSAETTLRAAHRARRSELLHQMAETHALGRSCEVRLKNALDRYRRIAPKRVAGGRIHRPTALESIVSFGRADAAFETVTQCLFERRQLEARRRKLEEDEEENARSLQAQLRENETRVWSDAVDPARNEEFLDNAKRRDLLLAVQKIRAEREAYNARLKADAVTPTERRLRSLAERGIELLALPIHAALIIDIEVYGGEAHYIVLADDGTKFWVPYEPALKVLMDTVFRAYRVQDAIEVTPAPGPASVSMSVLELIMTATRDAELARKIYKRQRQVAQTELTLTPCILRTEAEVEVTQRLCLFARNRAQARLTPLRAR